MSENLVGRKFARLMVIRIFGKRKGSRSILWECRCDCGKNTITRGGFLKSGKTKSCGCLQREKAAIQAKAMGKYRLTHGRSKTREYEAWHAMRQRCLTPTDAAYKNYGAKGVKVCKAWRTFEGFFAGMGEKPTSKHQLDRIDPTGDYKPSNCRWVTAKEQQRNRRHHILLTYKGETKCLSAWAETVGLKMLVLWHRLRVSAWPLEKALFTPVRPRRYFPKWSK